MLFFVSIVIYDYGNLFMSYPLSSFYGNLFDELERDFHWSEIFDKIGSGEVIKILYDLTFRFLTSYFACSAKSPRFASKKFFLMLPKIFLFLFYIFILFYYIPKNMLIKFDLFQYKMMLKSILYVLGLSDKLLYTQLNMPRWRNWYTRTT